MRPFPTIDDQVGQFLDTLVKRQAAHRPEPRGFAFSRLVDEMARRSVEGEQSEDHHPIIGKAA